MNKEKLLQIIENIANCMEENKQFLTELDTGIGDGDHGINMARGFGAVKAALPTLAEMPCGELLTAVGKILIKEVAGSAGPLYGSAFKCAGKVLGDKSEIALSDFAPMLESGIARIMQLGRATEGEKTMLDAMCPALRKLQEGGSLQDALQAAEAGVKHTEEIVATKGRASYVGERSLGHQDPGATSFALLLRVIAER